ncbi:MAG TPA: nitroreductase family protein [Planctomycetota bacterium]|nr:nitroreductase family protein [Planctomycetota bacterium]
MDLFDAIRNRASVRRLEPAEVSEEDLTQILDAGRRAPSGMNVQPLHYIVVRDRGTIEQLGQVQDFIAGASCVIAIVADAAASKYWLEDAAAAAENMLLAITALGYGSTWVEGTLLRREQWAKGLLGVPDSLRLIILVPIGKPASAPEQAPKKPLADLVHHERFGQ